MPGRALLPTILLFLLVAASSAQAADWRPPVDISTPQSSAGCGFLCTHPGAAGVEVAMNSRGDVVAAWMTREGSGSVVQAAFRPAGGRFGVPQTLGAVGTGCFLCQLGAIADAAIDDAGRAVVVWSAQVGGNRVIRAATKAPGAAFAPTFNLSDASQSADTSARLAMSPSGHTIVVWTMTTPNPDVVQFTARPPGGAFSAPTGLSSDVDADFADAAINNSGRATVAWNQSGAIVQARTRPAAGAAFGATRDLSVAGQTASTVDVAMDDQGRSIVTWERPNGSGDTQVQSRPLNADGTIAAGIDVMSDPGRDGSQAQVGLDAGGNAVATWIDCANAGGDCVVVVAGKPFGASFDSPDPVSAAGDSNFAPKVAVDGAGNATVAWSQFGTPARIQAIRRASNGTLVGGVRTLSSTAGTAFAPTLAVDNQGSVAAGWSFDRTSDSLETAQFGVFDAGPPELRNLRFSNGRALQPLGFSVGPFDRFSPVSVSWAFGDGSASTGPAVTKTFAGAGTFDARVTATDAAGNSASANSAVQVGQPDRDGDGFPQGQDCNDGNARIRPGAVEIRGNRVDENCDGRRPDFAPVRVTISHDFAAFVNGTRFSRFQVKRVPRGSTVRATCQVGRRKCPGKARKAFTKKRARGTVSLKKRYVGVFLPAKAKITVRVTKPRMIGAVKIVTIRARRAPKITDRCVRPGSRRIRRC